MNERFVDLLPDDRVLCWYFGIISHMFEHYKYFHAVADSSVLIYRAEESGDLDHHQANCCKDFIWTCISCYNDQ